MRPIYLETSIAGNGVNLELTYALLPKNASVEEVTKQINQWIAKNLDKEAADETSFALMRLKDLV